MQPYIQFLMLLGMAVIAGTTMIVASHFLGPRRPTEVKERPYESGMPPLGSAHERFSVKFYLVAVLFILFDIETVFLIPWAVIFMGTGTLTTGFLSVEMLVFMLILFVGYVYVWKRGAFQWDRCHETRRGSAQLKLPARQVRESRRLGGQLVACQFAL